MVKVEDDPKRGFIPETRDIQACILLMNAIHLVDPNVSQFWFEPIKKCIDLFELPKMVCSDCKSSMSFWDYHLAQGMCDKCSEKWSKENEAN